MLIPPLDTSAAGANGRDTYSFREVQRLRETWRAGQNKTANTYVIEIAFDPKRNPISAKLATRKSPHSRK